MRSARIHETRFDRAFNAVNIALVLLVTFLILLPLLNMVSCSFSDPGAVTTNQVFVWPVGLNLRAYQRLFALKDIWMGYGNSLFYAIVGTVINLVVTIMCAYPLSCRGLMGRKLLLSVFTFTMFFGGGTIPTYLVVRSCHLVNTRWALIIPGVMSVYNMILARTYFMTSIPGELREAAEIDGANELRVLLKIVLPLSLPILAVLAMYYAVGHWNGYMSGLIYLTDKNKYPLQLIIRDYLLSDSLLDELTSGGNVSAEYLAKAMGEREVLKYAIIIVSTLPMLILYPFVQKHFMKGVMVGSIKG